MRAGNGSDRQPAPNSSPRQFQTTRWSLVVAAGRQSSPAAAAALSELCQTYWYPVYAYIRRRTNDIHHAQDLTQTFFQQLLQKATIASADPDRGRFRAFLLTACKRFLINELQKAQAEKRGGGRNVLSLDFDSGESRYSVAAVDRLTPERLFEQQWAMTLLSQVLDELKADYGARDKAQQFEALKPLLTGGRSQTAYSEAARQLQLTDNAVRVAAHRFRQRYRELIRARIAETVQRPEDVDDEIRQLFGVFG